MIPNPDTYLTNSPNLVSPMHLHGRYSVEMTFLLRDDRQPVAERETLDTPTTSNLVLDMR